mmetsp:Transcript_38206/g.75196  ORF Transcript_38206/g.75196 Transcript_38206/m.75196 type:complete len:225 (+) Transcript_38206:33-707(+)
MLVTRTVTKIHANSLVMRGFASKTGWIPRMTTDTVYQHERRVYEAEKHKLMKEYRKEQIAHQKKEDEAKRAIWEKVKANQQVNIARRKANKAIRKEARAEELAQIQSKIAEKKLVLEKNRVAEAKRMQDFRQKQLWALLQERDEWITDFDKQLSEDLFDTRANPTGFWVKHSTRSRSRDSETPLAKFVESLPQDELGDQTEDELELLDYDYINRRRPTYDPKPY